MPLHVLIDGNNLLHAMRAHAPVPLVGRETMVKVIERWARQAEDKVTLCLDGHPPQGPMAKQFTSSRIDVRFSERLSADDLIVAVIKRSTDPSRLRLVSADTALTYEARSRGCAVTNPLEFIGELYPSKRAGAVGASPGGGEDARRRTGEKPSEVSTEEAKELEDMISGLADELDDSPPWP